MAMTASRNSAGSFSIGVDMDPSRKTLPRDVPDLSEICAMNPGRAMALEASISTSGKLEMPPGLVATRLAAVISAERGPRRKSMEHALFQPYGIIAFRRGISKCNFQVDRCQEHLSTGSDCFSVNFHDDPLN